jgi:hypothetical protein
VIWSYHSIGHWEPVIARTMLSAFTYSTVTDCPLGLLDLWTCCQYAEPTHRYSINFRCEASVDSEGVNCISEEVWILAWVKHCVNSDCICQWKIYWTRFEEFNVDVMITEIDCHTKLAIWKMGFILLSVHCAFLVVAVYFITDCIFFFFLLTSYNNWVHYRISNIGKPKVGFNCGDL